MPRNDFQYRYRLWLLAGLLLVFGVLFVVRGPVRGIDGGADLAHLYAAAALWIDGGNPYDGAQCVERMRQADHSNPGHVANGSFYPPPTIAVLAPLGLLSWDTARLLWLVINLAGCVMLVWALVQWLEIKGTRERWMLAALLVVAWGPIATTLSLGQLAIVSAACAFAGLVLLDRGQVWIPGLLVGVSCLVKPQLGLGFWLLILLRRDWRAAGVATAIIALASGIGMGRLMLTAPDWAGQLASNIARYRADGAALDASLEGPMRYQMIDLHPLLHLVLPGAQVGAAALLLVALLAAAALVRLFQMGLRRCTLLAASGVGLLLLMPVYHRYYDAILLLPLLVLICNALQKDRRDVLMWVIALAMLLLVFPLPAIFATLVNKGVLPDALTSSWAWQHLVMQCHSWALLIAAVALVCWTLHRASIKNKSLIYKPSLGNEKSSSF